MSCQYALIIFALDPALVAECTSTWDQPPPWSSGDYCLASDPPRTADAARRNKSGHRTRDSAIQTPATWVFVAFPS